MEYCFEYIAISWLFTHRPIAPVLQDSGRANSNQCSLEIWKQPPQFLYLRLQLRGEQEYADPSNDC
jgi:hypothetical protein